MGIGGIIKGVSIQESGQLLIENHGDTESMEYHGG